MVPEDATADGEGAVGVVHGGGGEDAGAQAGDGGEDLEGGAWGVDAVDGAVGPGARLGDLLGFGEGEARGEIVEIVIGQAGEREDFAGVDVDGDGGADEVEQALLGGLLEVDVDRECEVLALDGEAFLEGGIDAIACGVDAEDGAAGLALEDVVELALDAVLADGALHLEGGEVAAGQVRCFEIDGRADEAEHVRGGGFVGIRAGAGCVHLERGADGEVLDEVGVLLGGQVVDERVGEQHLAAEVPHEVGGIDASGAADGAVDLVEVALDDGRAGDALHLPG